MSHYSLQKRNFAKKLRMAEFEVFYHHCPVCSALLAGKKMRTETVRFSQLYSDGLMLCDGWLSTTQMIVQCPSCSHVYWLDTVKDNTESENKSTTHSFAYSYKSWYQFGCETTSIEGKNALIEQYLSMLRMMKPCTHEQELYLRKRLLWAFNDLVRDRSVVPVWRVPFSIKGIMEWHRYRKKQLRQFLLFRKWKYEYISNIKRLIELVRSCEERAYEKTFLAELYREKGNFKKSAEILQQLGRSTHFVAYLLEKVQRKNSLVFLVAG